MYFKHYLSMSPFLSVGEEHVTVDDVVQVVAKEVSEVVEVLDANVLQKFKIANKNGRTSSLINNAESRKKSNFENFTNSEDFRTN